MPVRRVLLAGLLACATGTAARAGAAPFPTPPVDVVDRIRREYLAEWILVTTPSASYELKAKEIRIEGLSGLEPRRSSAPVPARLTWSEVERIDVRKTHGLKGALWGALGGALIGELYNYTGAGSYEGAADHEYTRWGAVTGGVLGAWLGHRHRTEHQVYLARRRPDDAAPSLAGAATADTLAALAALGVPGTQPDSASLTRAAGAPAPSAAPSAPATPEIERACRMVSTDDVIRIEGSFGRFEGHATSISPDGLEGLRRDPAARSAPSVRSLDWQQVDRLDVQRNGVLRGAVRGTLIMATVAVVATGIAYAIEGQAYAEGPTLTAFVAYFGVMAIPVGTVIGAIAGGSKPYWKEVYRR